MFIPTTKSELKKLKWEKLDVILISGDAYIDSPNIGIAIIGQLLIKEGYKVGIIGQPDIESDKDLLRLGEPKLYWGISGGAIDSMVANYTALKKRRKHDDMTPGEINNKRPDMATIVYTNLIKKYSKSKKPIILGGIEASLRRLTHFDYIKEKIRHSILFDSQADALLYGMAEQSVLEITEKIKNNEDYTSIKGICYTTKTPSSYVLNNYIKLPSYDDIIGDKNNFEVFFKAFYDNNDPLISKGLIQKQDRSRFVIQNPPQPYLEQKELDNINNLPYERDAHPFYKNKGEIKALATMQFSITTHRGCYGECNFCAIAVHQGATIRSRSKESIIKEVKDIAKHKNFKGIINDVGGPTANMFTIECDKKISSGKCINKRCVFPQKCDNLTINHRTQIELLKDLSKIKNIKKIFIASGIRYDMILNDKKYGKKYLKYIVENHISGQMKIAPEHISDNVLNLMGKPSNRDLIQFKRLFDQIAKNKMFLTYYFIATHPGSTIKDMQMLKQYTSKELKINPRQVQIFTPTPSTYSTLMYYTEKNPFNNKKIFVEKKNKEMQKSILFKNFSKNKKIKKKH